MTTEGVEPVPPGRPTTDPRPLPTPAWVEPLAWFVGVAGPAARSLVMPDGHAELVIPAAVFAVAGMAALGRTPLARYAVGLVAAVVAGLAAGEVLGVWVGLTAFLADAGVRRRPFTRSLEAPPVATAFASVVAAGVAAVWGRNGESGPWPLVPLLGALAVSAVSMRWGGTVDRGLRAFGRGVSTTVTGLTFGVLGIVAVVLPWTVAAPLAWSRRTARGAWQPRSIDGGSSRPWAQTGVRRSGLRQVIASVLAATLVAGGFWFAIRRADDPPGNGDVTRGPGSWWEEPDGTPAAYEGEAWYPEYRRDVEWVMNQGVAFLPLHQLRVADVATRYVNVEDGVRRTWRPPECRCRRITLWMYGGSTTFGIGQRDGHTIASELARRAWKDGIALDVVNRGVPGDLHWQEASRYGWDLTTGEPPDIVVFYDGANEIWAQIERSTHGSFEPTGPGSPMIDQFWRDVLSRYESETPPPPPGAEVATTAPPGSDDPEETGRAAAVGYERALVVSRALADRSRVSTFWFWQPSRLSRPPVQGEPENTTGEDRIRSIYRAAESTIPVGVDDLTDVFAGEEGPLFTDDVHHNERGARIVAAAMFDRLESELRRGGDES